MGKSLPSLSFDLVKKTAGNLSLSWSWENTKEKILEGFDLRAAGVFMASGLEVLSTASEHTLN